MLVRMNPRGKAKEKTHTTAQSTTRTDEETGTNGTTNGNHVQMARLHGAVELDDTMAIVLPPERVQIETGPGQEILILEAGVNVAGRIGPALSDGLDLSLGVHDAVDGDRVLGRHDGSAALLSSKSAVAVEAAGRGGRVGSGRNLRQDLGCLGLDS